MEGEQVEHSKDYNDPPPAPLIDMQELRVWSFYRAIIAELVATLLFAYITISTIIGSKKNNTNCKGVGPLGVAWSFGGMVFLLVYCNAGISGGHLNPAITFAFFVARKVSLSRAGMYILAQCVGAMCGAALVDLFQHGAYVSGGGGVNKVQKGYTKMAALAAEIVGTFIVVYTVFSATDPKRNARDSHVPVLAPLPIGFAVFMVHLATMPITGTGINPARSFGPAVVYGHRQPLQEQWIFWMGPMIGATTAAVYHQYVLRAAGVKSLPFLSGRSQPASV